MLPLLAVVLVMMSLVLVILGPPVERCTASHVWHIRMKAVVRTRRVVDTLLAPAGAAATGGGGTPACYRPANVAIGPRFY